MPRNATMFQQPEVAQQTREQIREQIRENVRQSLEAAQARREAEQAVREAQQEAQQAAREAQAAAQEAAPGIPVPTDARRVTIKDGKITVVGEDGRVTEINADAREAIAGVPGFGFQPEIPREAVTIFIAFFAMLAAIIIGLPLARAFARRMDRRTVQPAVPPEISQQLLRLEQSVDTIAVEIERISEAQRFSSGLLREMHPILQRTQGAAPALLDRANGDNR